jgi:hypothetical protein
MTAPPLGERAVFNMLAAGPENWVALHSLDLAPWNRGLRTEIDFVVMVPEAGILCIEVKSQDSIRFEDGRWTPPNIKRSPFKQASDGRYTFCRRLRDLAPRFKHIPVVHCCIFPNAIFDLKPNLSVQPWELMDARTFRTFARATDFCADLKARIVRSIEADANLKPLITPLPQTKIEEIIRFCVPVQARRVGAAEEIESRQREMEHVLREQQKPVLRLAELNPRLVIYGGAGTGKTLIAMELARRFAEKGHRVALLCFNQLVGEWMTRQMDRIKPTMPNLVVGRAIQVMTSLAGIEIPNDSSSDFWQDRLPQQLEEHLTDPELSAAAAFDYLVLDEAQDLLARPRLLACLMQFLSGGLENGFYTLFGDFENQVLTDRRVLDETLLALTECAKPSRWQLSENCRNYRIIGESAVRLSGFERPVYSGYMRSGGGAQNYDIFFYRSEDEQSEQLELWLKEFTGRGYRPADIAILSFRSTESCAALQLKRRGVKLRPAWQTGEAPGYTSVHAFKGMESKIAILTDVLAGEPDFYRGLFYTGMTRATESIRILCNEKCQEALIKWFEQ